MGTLGCFELSRSSDAVNAQVAVALSTEFVPLKIVVREDDERDVAFIDVYYGPDIVLTSECPIHSIVIPVISRADVGESIDLYFNTLSAQVSLSGDELAVSIKFPEGKNIYTSSVVIDVSPAEKSVQQVVMLNLLKAPFIQDAITRTILEVGIVFERAGVSSSGFNIDGSYCDYLEVDTTSISDIIDNAASQLAVHGSPTYQAVVDFICHKVTKQFSD